MWKLNWTELQCHVSTRLHSGQSLYKPTKSNRDGAREFWCLRRNCNFLCLGSLQSSLWCNIIFAVYAHSYWIRGSKDIHFYYTNKNVLVLVQHSLACTKLGSSLKWRRIRPQRCIPSSQSFSIPRSLSRRLEFRTENRCAKCRLTKWALERMIPSYAINFPSLENRFWGVYLNIKGNLFEMNKFGGSYLEKSYLKVPHPFLRESTIIPTSSCVRSPTMQEIELLISDQQTSQNKCQMNLPLGSWSQHRPF